MKKLVDCIDIDSPNCYFALLDLHRLLSECMLLFPFWKSMQFLYIYLKPYPYTTFCFTWIIFHIFIITDSDYEKDQSYFDAVLDFGLLQRLSHLCSQENNTKIEIAAVRLICLLFCEGFINQRRRHITRFEYSILFSSLLFVCVKIENFYLIL